MITVTSVIPMATVVPVPLVLTMTGLRDLLAWVMLVVLGSFVLVPVVVWAHLSSPTP